MAIYTTHLRFRQAPVRREDYEADPAEDSSLAGIIPMQRLNELAADGRVRLRASSLFVTGLAALVTILTLL